MYVKDLVYLLTTRAEPDDIVIFQGFTTVNDDVLEICEEAFTMDFYSITALGDGTCTITLPKEFIDSVVHAPQNEIKRKLKATNKKKKNKQSAQLHENEVLTTNEKD